MLPLLACGPLTASQITPTPTKTPRKERNLVTLPTVTNTPESTPTLPPTDTPVPTPIPTDTPTPLPTDTPTPDPTPTNPPPPPPPPTSPPAEAPPPDTPAEPPPPPPVDESKPEVIVQLPGGSSFSPGDEVKIIFIVRDPDGVNRFTWGIFLQNLSPLVGGDKVCNGAPECQIEVKEEAPPLKGTYIVGADAVDVLGNTSRGISEIYVP